MESPALRLAQADAAARLGDSDHSWRRQRLGGVVEAPWQIAVRRSLRACDSLCARRLCGVAGRRGQVAACGAADAAGTRLAGSLPDRGARACARRALPVAGDGENAVDD